MKKILLSAWLLFGIAASAQIISIPDVYFKNKLILSSVTSGVAKDVNGDYFAIDANTDGLIDQSEALQVYELDVHNSFITSLTGIEAFTNLKKLNCGTNSLTSLDVTALTNLLKLDCRVNNLQTINVSGLSNLNEISFEFNPITGFVPTGLTGLTYLNARMCSLTSLDLSLFPSLVTLSVHNNQLTSLNASAAPNLDFLACNNNQISNLSISGLPLTYLNYSNNPLPDINVSEFTSLTFLSLANTGTTTLDLTGLTALANLECSNNPIPSLNTEDLTGLSQLYCNNTLLTQLDLSHSPNLKWFGAGDNPLLTSVNIHNGSLIEYPGECNLSNNPNLQMLCLDEDEEAIMLEYFEWNQLVPPYMSTTCEYIPGQIYNSIAGTIRLDLDGNGCTVTDAAPGYYQVKIFDGTTEKIKFTNQDGEYFALVGPGAYTVSAPYEGTLFTSTPATASVSFPGMDNTAFVQDFCVVPNGQSDDVSVIIGAPLVMPGFDSYYHIYFSNNGNTIANGTVTFNYNAALQDYVLANPAEDTATAGALTWNYTNLMPFEHRTLLVKLNINAPTDVPAVNIDDILSYSATITLQGTDINPSDNTYNAESLVVGSFDPNNIICMEGDKEPVENIGKYLNYVVNFENTGNAAAEFVVISQQIDAAKFDVSSFEVLNSSHEVDITRIGNIITYRFENINLGAAVQGNVVFRIKTLQTLEDGDQVMNKANIVFDYNYAIVTDEAVTTFETILGLDNPVYDKKITVYPNPAKDSITINAENDILEVELYDIQGRLVQLIKINAASAQIDLTGRQSGIYILKVTTAKGVMVQKVVKQ